MKSLRRVTVILAIVCLMLGYSSVCLAQSDWYMPQPMSSSEAAITAIRELATSLALVGAGSITDFHLDQSGLWIYGVGSGGKERFSLPFRQLESFDFDYDPKGLIYSSLHFQVGSQGWQLVCVDSRIHGRRLLDAVVTLALAQQASLDPYYPFNILKENDVYYINKVLKNNNLSSGAVAAYVDPHLSPLDAEDIIVQVSYAGKVVPIKDREGWRAAARDAIAGKPEETMRVRFVRKGVAMEKEVKLIAYGSNVQTNQSNPATPSASPKQGFGVQLRLMDATELKSVGLDLTVGFLVVSVAKDSEAEKMQIKANDVLLSINGVDIGSMQQLSEQINKGQIVAVKLWRGGTAVSSQTPFSF